MPRKIVSSLVVSLLVSLGALGAAATAGAATTTQLALPQSDAFQVLRVNCNGIAEHVYATGFASNGYPTGATHLETTCIGRFGHRFTYTAWASATWTWYGETRSYGKLAEEPAGLSTSFSAEDSHGDRIYNTAAAAFLETTAPPIAAPEPPTGVGAYAYRTGEEGESGPQDFSIGWSLAPETAGLITSSTVTATPVGSSAPTLTATVTGAGEGVVLGPLEPVTTYLITVTSTDAEGTSRESTPLEAKSLTVVQLVPPIAVTEPAAGVTATGATLEGHVNPAGEPVEVCQFEYGMTEAYGTVVPCSSLPGEGETPLPVSAPVGGLTPNTTYHVRLTATGPGGTSHGGDWPFTTLPLVAAPTVTALSPKSGSAAGGTVVKVTGTGLTGATAVMFGSAEAHIVAVNSNASITVDAPAGSVGTAVNVTVTTPGGTSAITSKDLFRYVPTVAGISPASGSTAGGTSVTVTGTGFGPGNTATVFKFGTTKATSVDCTSTTECTVLSPAHAAGVVDVKATVDKATSSTSRPADEFSYS